MQQNIGTMYWVWDANAVSKGAYVPLTVGSGAYNLAMNGAFCTTNSWNNLSIYRSQ
jgi:hypothetical protein